MFSVFERMVAWRYLRARRSEGFISVIAVFSFLGIMLGVATLIIVMSVMNGFRTELMNQILGFNGHIHIEAKESLSYYPVLIQELEKEALIKSAIPLIEQQAMATHEVKNSNGASLKYASGAMIQGIEPSALKTRQKIAENIIEGSLEGFQGAKILVGSRMANRLHLHRGQKLTLISPDANQTAFGITPRMKSFEVAGIFEVGMENYDNMVVFMPLDMAQVFFRMPHNVSSVQVYLEDGEKAPAITAELQRILGADFRVSEWQSRTSKFFNALTVQKNVMFLILSLIILIASFNVISSMIMLVKDKAKDIAILRTMGATRAVIMRTFLLTGSSIGIFGTFMGCVLGLSFSLNIETIRQWLESLTGTELFQQEIYFLAHLPSKVDSFEVFMVVALSLFLSFLATLYPSWRAGRLDPVEALRYE